VISSEKDMMKFVDKSTYKNLGTKESEDKEFYTYSFEGPPVLKYCTISVMRALRHKRKTTAFTVF
jgi:hypothetical protein